MTSPLLVTGGTGTLGRLVVGRLRAAGCEVRVLSRRSRAPGAGVEYVTGDLAKDEGITSAVQGAAVVVHLASDKKGDAEATRNLVRAASAQDRPPHLVYISIVGVDSLSFGYFRSKLASEQIVAGSKLPWTTLRATQFYDLILTGAQKAAKLPVVPVPSGFLVQPVDADEVAARLVDLALGRPSGRVPDMGGPKVSSAAELIQGYLRATHRRRKVLPVRMPGTGPIRAGGLLVPDKPAGPAAGRRTWEEFLAARLR
ncbi:SDR family oxidoreductase [Streptomyces sp. NPDC005408]|uniref:SDR family oxidoreductase n=1 Tax=Streptomyces sp. NPDC005408 TaxID=3155341 RepID=UPI0033AB7D9B